MSRASVTILGGGIAGLTAARALSERCRVTVVEQANMLGGKVRTTMFRDRPFDLGPDAFITRNPAAIRLASALGLSDELIAPSASSAAIWSRGRLRPFPTGLALGVPTDLAALYRSGIVSPRGVARAALDYVLPGRQPLDLVDQAHTGRFDPSVAELLGRRLGAEVLGALVDPLIGGINASDVEVLSFVAATPQLAAQVAGRRSVARALRPPERPAGSSTSPPPVFNGLQHGLGSLVDALRDDLLRRGVRIETDTAALGIARRAGGTGYCVETTRAVLDADALVLALPAWVTSELVAHLAPQLGAECHAIPYAGVVTTTLAWPLEAVPGATTHALAAIARRTVRSGSTEATRLDERCSADVLPGSGVLVPRRTGRLITAATFTSTKWPRSAGPGEIVVRASAGRHDDERAQHLDDDALTEAVRADLAVILGITTPPIECRVERWPLSFPQYVSGHLARVARIRALTRELGAVAVCGSGYDGIGIPACIDGGERAAVEITAALDG